MIRLLTLASTTAFLASGAALAQDLPGDAIAGRAFAEEICAACHAVGKGQYGVSLEGAPAFQEVAEDSAATALALRVFLRTPHENMPDLILSEAETDNVISYILSLKK